MPNLSLLVLNWSHLLASENFSSSKAAPRLVELSSSGTHFWRSRSRSLYTSLLEMSVSILKPLRAVEWLCAEEDGEDEPTEATEAAADAEEREAFGVKSRFSQAIIEMEDSGIIKNSSS